ncbi:hypothetical protein [Paenibacillus sp. Pae108]|uniref:hypothetical protein n=1 Tax=Paenibacillus sp. Pae108 TaxID=2926019 RepID=UPI00211802D9|nr:hypothetical protein [Paenibacillus sp. Pae108]
MKVQIEDNLYIESDTYGYMVKQYNGTRVNDKGAEVEVYSTLANYGSIKGCCKFILNLKIKESTAATLSELIQDVKRIEAYIESKVKV